MMASGIETKAGLSLAILSKPARTPRRAWATPRGGFSSIVDPSPPRQINRSLAARFARTQIDGSRKRQIGPAEARKPRLQFHVRNLFALPRRGRPRRRNAGASLR